MNKKPIPETVSKVTVKVTTKGLAKKRQVKSKSRTINGAQPAVSSDCACMKPHTASGKVISPYCIRFTLPDVTSYDHSEAPFTVQFLLYNDSNDLYDTITLPNLITIYTHKRNGGPFTLRQQGDTPEQAIPTISNALKLRNIVNASGRMTEDIMINFMNHAAPQSSPSTSVSSSIGSSAIASSSGFFLSLLPSGSNIYNNDQTGSRIVAANSIAPKRLYNVLDEYGQETNSDEEDEQDEQPASKRQNTRGGSASSSPSMILVEEIAEQDGQLDCGSATNHVATPAPVTQAVHPPNQVGVSQQAQLSTMPIDDSPEQVKKLQPEDDSISPEQSTKCSECSSDVSDWLD